MTFVPKGNSADDRVNYYHSCPDVALRELEDAVLADLDKLDRLATEDDPTVDHIPVTEDQ